MTETRKIRYRTDDGAMVRVDLEYRRLPVLKVKWLAEREKRPACTSGDNLPVALDVCGRRRSPATFSGFRKGQAPKNAGCEFPPTPPSPEHVLAILEQGSKTSPAHIRDRAIFALVWRSGLRISEALALQLSDVSAEHNSVLVRKGKGDKRRISGIDSYGLELIQPWVAIRDRYPGEFFFCIVEGKTKGGRVGDSQVRAKLHKWADAAMVPERCAPHQLRHAHAVDLAREGVPLHHISRQLGHANLAITTTYLQGIAPTETIAAIAARPRPDAPAELEETVA